MQPLPEQEIEVFCATHRGVPTGLRCGKCEKPICPRCLIHTPVGPRCRECAQLRRLPVFEVGPLHYLRAAGAGIAIALIAGLIWGILPFSGFFSFLLSPLTGYCVGEGVSHAANRRQSLGLKVLAGGGVLLAYLVARGGLHVLAASAFLLAGSPFPLLTILVGSLIGTLLNPFAWIIIALGAYIAISRIG